MVTMIMIMIMMIIMMMIMMMMKKLNGHNSANIQARTSRFCMVTVSILL